jgi:hypothetical protein
MNCADIFTEHVKADVLQKHLKEVGITSSVDKHYIGMLNHTSNFETINFTDMIQYEYYTKTQDVFGDESVSASEFLVDFSRQVVEMEPLIAIPENT